MPAKLFDASKIKSEKLRDYRPCKDWVQLPVPILEGVQVTGVRVVEVVNRLLGVALREVLLAVEGQHGRSTLWIKIFMSIYWDI